MNNSKQYKNNHPCIVYAKMTTYGKQLHLGTCIGTLLISSGGGGGVVSYYRVKVLLKRHSKVQVLAKLQLVGNSKL